MFFPCRPTPRLKRPSLRAGQAFLCPCETSLFRIDLMRFSRLKARLQVLCRLGDADCPAQSQPTRNKQSASSGSRICPDIDSGANFLRLLLGTRGSQKFSTEAFLWYHTQPEVKPAFLWRRGRLPADGCESDLAVRIVRRAPRIRRELLSRTSQVI